MKVTNAIFHILVGVMVPLIFSPVSAQTPQVAGSMTGRGNGGFAHILPLKETSVELEITANLVHAKVRQVFFNDTDMNLEAVYVFPLPSEATITGMELEIGDRLIRSVVQERQQAKAAYRAAVSNGQKAALLEQERPNLFTTSVANFQPGEEIVVSFSYLQQLPFQAQLYEISFPTTFGPRYIPSAEPNLEAFQSDNLTSPNEPAVDMVQAHRISPPVAEEFSEHLFQFKAVVRGLPVEDIYSNTHQILAEDNGDGTYDISLDGAGDLPDRDLVLKLQLYGQEVPQIGFVQSSGKTGTHGLLSIYPPLDDDYEVTAVPKDVVFLIDTSGSMEGASIVQARHGLLECLNILNEGDHFNIVRFSDTFSSFSEFSLPATELNMDEAGAYVRALAAGGGTEMQQALNHVLEQPSAQGFMRMVVFLTDGDVGNEFALMRLMEEKVKQTRLFSFGVGSAPNEFLLKKLSEKGYGVANFLRNGEDIGEAMANFFETINAPVLTEVQVAFMSRDGELLENLVAYPSLVPDVFMGRPVQLCYHYPDFFQGAIQVSGFLGGELVTYEYESGNVPKRAFPGIDKLFGRARVDDRMSAWIKARSSQEKEVVRQEIVELGLAYQLLTKFTSRIAVEEVVTASTAPALVAVPVMAKQGSHFSATATGDPLRLLLGDLALLLGMSAAVIRKSLL